MCWETFLFRCIIIISFKACQTLHCGKIKIFGSKTLNTLFIIPERFFWSTSADSFSIFISPTWAMLFVNFFARMSHFTKKSVFRTNDTLFRFEIINRELSFTISTHIINQIRIFRGTCVINSFSSWSYIVLFCKMRKMVWIRRYYKSMWFFVKSARMFENELKVWKLIMIFVGKELQFSLIWWLLVQLFDFIFYTFHFELYLRNGIGYTCSLVLIEGHTNIWCLLTIKRRSFHWFVHVHLSTL